MSMYQRFVSIVLTDALIKTVVEQFRRAASLILPECGEMSFSTGFP